MNKYKAIATKVSEDTEKALERICGRKGITIYEMLQMMCDCIVRYMSKDTNLSEEMEQAMNIFEHMDGWKDAYNLADYETDTIVDKALYFVGDQRKKGMRAVLLERPFMGTWSQTVNVQDILERVINWIFPSLYKRLRTIGGELECHNMLETIDILTRLHEHDGNYQSIREEFEDCNRSDYGQKPHEHHYRRKTHKDINAFGQQQTIHFTSDDQPPLPEIDMTEDLDEKIGKAFGYEG